MSRLPLFGYGGEVLPQKGRPTIRRDRGGHERWAEAIMPADAEAGIIETPTSRKPLLAVVGIVVLATGLLITQLVRLQILDGQRNLGLADGNRLRQTIIRADRGVIYDRHNLPLVKNVGNFDVVVTPSLLPRKPQDRLALYARAGALLNRPASQIQTTVETDCIKSEVSAKLPKSRAEFDCLNTTQTRLVATNIDRETYLNFDQALLTVPGFSLEPNPIRQYEDGGSLAAILGYTGRVTQDELARHPEYTANDLVGKLGLERQYESVLRGQDGSEQTEVDATGRPIKLLSAKPSRVGRNVVLSIDMDLQRTLSTALQNQMQASGSKQAAGIALNPKTGEILAAVNLPSYDNNLFAKGISQADYNNLLSDTAQPLFNKVIGGAYPTGSIIKPFIGSAALQEHVITPSATVEDTGSLEVTNKYDNKVKYTFRSYEPGGLGIVNISKAIAVSSNVFFYTVGGGFGNIGGLGVDRLVSYYHKFGLGQKTGVDIAEDAAGTVPTPETKKKTTGEDWFLGDTYNISVGQGDIRASPLQMAVATAAIANGGTVLKPHFVKQVSDSSGTVQSKTPVSVVTKDFISPANLKIIQNAMRDVVKADYGTACCNIERQVPVAVAAKTGTAETDPTGNRKPHAWFEAYAPFDDPQIVIVALVTNSGEGAQFAAPAVRETLAWCFSRPGGCVQ